MRKHGIGKGTRPMRKKSLTFRWWHSIPLLFLVLLGVAVLGIASGMPYYEHVYAEHLASQGEVQYTSLPAKE